VVFVDLVLQEAKIELFSSASKVVNWLFTGVLATVFFGFYGLFGKLSIFQNPVISNLMIYVTAVSCGVILILATRKRVLFSLEAFLSGISSGIAALTVLHLLVSNLIVVVFSFVSFASAIFFTIILIFEKPKLSVKQRSFAVVGILVSTFGLFLASVSMGGGSYLLMSSAFNPYSFLLGSVIPIGFGLWAYFSFVAIEKRNVEVPIAFLNYSFGSLVVAVISFSIFWTNSPLQAFNFSEFRNFFPVLAGLSLVGGDILTLKSYEMTSGDSRIQETIIAILSNAEIIPLMCLSYVILKEFAVEGFIGAFVVFFGISILNCAQRAG
jgi:hypothetical protein